VKGDDIGLNQQRIENLIKYIGSIQAKAKAI